MFESGFRDKSGRNRKASSEGRWFALLRSVWPQIHGRQGKEREKRRFSLLYGDFVWDEDAVPVFHAHCSHVFRTEDWIFRDSLRPPGPSQSLRMSLFSIASFCFRFLNPHPHPPIPSWHWLYNSARLPRQRHVSPFLIGMYLSDPQLSDSKSFLFFFFFFFFGSLPLHETVKGRGREREREIKKEK